MSDVQLYLLEVDANKVEAAKIAERTAQKLETRNLTLLELIESLGESLNNDDFAFRAKALAYLSDVLNALPGNIFSRQQRDLLNDFVLSRIENGGEGLGHCAKALIALEKFGSFDSQRAQRVVTTLIDHTSPLNEFKQQNERFSVLTLIDLLLSHYRQAIRALHDTSTEFLPRFIEYFDGEKDPRNLMVVFSILRVPMVEWDVSESAADLFEAVFNYFPITFRPPPDDPYGITAQQLKERLRDCIASTASFAPHSFPALLDKLDSTSVNVKRDALQTLAACAGHYGPAAINLYSVTLWDALKFEILNMQEEDLALETLKCLNEIAFTLSTSPHEEPLQTYLKPIMKECKEHLEDAPTKQSSAAGRILSSVSRASSQASSAISKGVLPHIFELYKGADTISKRRGLLEELNRLLESNISTFGAWRAAEVGNDVTSQDDRTIATLRPSTNAFIDHSASSLTAFSSALVGSPVNEVSFRLLGLNGLRNLCIGRQLLEDASIIVVIRNLDEIIIRETPYGKDEVKAAAIDALVEIAHQKPQLVIETAMPDFSAELPDNDEGIGNAYVPILEAFAKLSAERQVFGTLIVRLKNKLDAAVRQQASSKYILCIFYAMLYAFTHGGVDLGDPSVFGKYYQDVVVRLVGDVSGSSGSDFAMSDLRNDEAIMEVIGRICNLILRPQPWVAQTEICRNIYVLFREVPIDTVAPFAITQVEDSARTMIVSLHLVAALNREATPHTDISELLAALMRFSNVSGLSTHVQDSTIRQITVIANKYVPASKTASVITPHLESLPLKDTKNLTPTALRIAFGLLKALVLRTDPQLKDILPRFLALLHDDTYGTPAARGFSTLLAPDDLLTKKNHCLIYSLHKQRLFSLAVPSLLSEFRVGKETTKRNILIALSGLLYHFPYELLRSDSEQFPQLVPLLLQSLAIDDTDVKANSIATFSRIVLEDPHLVEEHVGSLVNRMLAVSAAAGSKHLRYSTSTARDSAAPVAGKPMENGMENLPCVTPRTRAAALSCLGTFPGAFRADLVLPHKQRVVKNLAVALDDDRRAVRAEAVRTRTAWIGIGGMAGEEDADD